MMTLGKYATAYHAVSAIFHGLTTKINKKAFQNKHICITIENWAILETLLNFEKQSRLLSECIIRELNSLTHRNKVTLLEGTEGTFENRRSNKKSLCVAKKKSLFLYIGLDLVIRKS